MKAKKGVSLIVLIITIMVTAMLTGIVIVQTKNVLHETEKEQFIIQISNIETKVREYYLLKGSLPIKGGEEYTVNTLVPKVDGAENQMLLEDEIIINKDKENTFLIIDLDLMQIQPGEIKKELSGEDGLVVATNTLNVYYLNGIKIDGVMRFSLANLVDKNLVSQNTQISDTTVVLDSSLDVIKSTNVWTNNVSVTIKNKLEDDEVLNYSIGGANSKTVPKDKTIVINATNLTDDEKQAFDNNAEIVITRLKGNVQVDAKTISLANLDITRPKINEITAAASEEGGYNKITVDCSDEGGSKVQAIYYDYVSVIEDGEERLYYSYRTNVTANELVNFGKISSDGIINLGKDIKSIVVVAKDNAGNVSDVITYNVELED